MTSIPPPQQVPLQRSLLNLRFILILILIISFDQVGSSRSSSSFGKTKDLYAKSSVLYNEEGQILQIEYAKRTLIRSFSSRHLSEPTSPIQDIGSDLELDRKAVEEVIESLICTALEQVGMNEQPTEGGRVIDAGCLYVDCGNIMGVGVGGREIEEEYVSFPIQPKKLDNLSDAIVACGGEVDLHVFRRHKIHVFKGVEKKDVERVLERLEMYKDDV
ncbi:hypothetical protein TrLO_g5873 [Triparma laevis f. longispina]|uniref:Uncharacterized protein n=1 Tax=Triparma laevis f. longispina TaxID=1714387 RepID=A0A9W7BZM4_9STRA|nr:hypothetical protein TrLO_g5873 [Triparma laevis f. longispina]